MKYIKVMFIGILLVLLVACGTTQKAIVSQAKPILNAESSEVPSAETPTETQPSAPEPSTAPIQEPPVPIPAPAASDVKEFKITEKSYSFDPGTITVKKGDKVRFIVSVPEDDVPHGFAITKYGINQDLRPGDTKTIEFTADQAGSYRIYCSIPCGSGHREMHGTLVVE